MIRTKRTLGAVIVALVTGGALVGCGAGGASTNTASSKSATHASGPGSPQASPTSKDGSGSPQASPTSKDGSGSPQASPSSGGGSGNSGRAGQGSSGAGEPSGARAESRTPTKSGRQTAVLNRVPGSGSVACQQVSQKQRDLRAGSFVVGPFDTAISTYGKKHPGFTRTTVRLYWVPLHSKPMSGLILRLTNLDTGTSQVVRQKQVADAEQWKFYDTQLNLKRAGTWRVQASAGPDHGCVTFTVGKA